MPKMLRWSKVGLGEWHGRLVTSTERTDSGKASEVVAVATRTGSHLDNYPWDWYFTTYGSSLVYALPPKPCPHGETCPNPKVHHRRMANVTDTLRAAKQEVEDNLATQETM